MKTLTPSIQLGGFVPFSASDYPEHLVCVAFIQGCNWRCGYCHNPHLQSRKAHPMAPQWAEVVAFLKQRQQLLDAIVFSGGEPTIDPHLPTAVATAKDLGFKVGLHTTGAYPRRLKSILPLLDWVGFDFKTRWEDYHEVIVHAQPVAMVQDSLQALIASNCDYEIRTTVHSALHDAADLLAMAEFLHSQNIEAWVLQNFRAEGCIDDQLIQLQPHDPTLISPALKEKIKTYVPKLIVR